MQKHGLYDVRKGKKELMILKVLECEKAIHEVMQV